MSTAERRNRGRRVHSHTSLINRPHLGLLFRLACRNCAGRTETELSSSPATPAILRPSCCSAWPSRGVSSLPCTDMRGSPPLRCAGSARIGAASLHRRRALPSRLGRGTTCQSRDGLSTLPTRLHWSPYWTARLLGSSAAPLQRPASACLIGMILLAIVRSAPHRARMGLYRPDRGILCNLAVAPDLYARSTSNAALLRLLGFISPVLPPMLPRPRVTDRRRRVLSSTDRAGTNGAPTRVRDRTALADVQLPVGTKGMLCTRPAWLRRPGASRCWTGPGQTPAQEVKEVACASRADGDDKTHAARRRTEPLHGETR